MFLAVLIGVAAGAVSSLLGLGGGLIVVPILRANFAMTISEAAAPSLLIAAVSSLAGVQERLRDHDLDFRQLLVLEAAIVGGGLAGAQVGPLFRDELLRALFLFLHLVVIAKTVTTRRHRPVASTTQARVPDRRFVLVATLAVCAAILSAMLGVGGGLFFVPILVYAGGFTLYQATSWSTYLIGGVAFGALVRYLPQMTFHLTLTVQIVLGVAVGSYLGAQLGRRLPHRVIETLYVLVLSGNFLKLLLH